MSLLVIKQALVKKVLKTKLRDSEDNQDLHVLLAACGLPAGWPPAGCLLAAGWLLPAGCCGLLLLAAAGCWRQQQPAAAACYCCWLLLAAAEI